MKITLDVDIIATAMIKMDLKPGDQVAVVGGLIVAKLPNAVVSNEAIEATRLVDEKLVLETLEQKGPMTARMFAMVNGLNAAERLVFKNLLARLRRSGKVMALDDSARPVYKAVRTEG